MLIFIVGHQIDQKVRDQQNVTLIAPRQQGQPQKRQHRQQDKIQLPVLHTFREGLHGVEKHRQHDGKQRGIAVEHKILIPVGHHPVSGPCKVASGEEKPQQGYQKQPRRCKQILFVFFLPAKNRPDHEPEGDDRHIDGGVLLDRQGQKRGDRDDAGVFPVDPVEQPQQQRHQKAVFVDIIAGAAGKGRIKQEDSAQEHSLHTGQAVVLSDPTKRDHRRCHHRRLKHLQGDRRRHQQIERQQKIPDRRHMYQEV